MKADTFRDLTLPSMTDIAGSGGYPVGRGLRWLLVGWSLVLLGGFALAFALTPDPRGYGTHQRLGLPPCSFRAMLGIPCPACGMTTSFSHLMHGNMPGALRANPGGVLLALVCAAQVPWCWLSASRGRLAGVADPAKCLLWLILAVACVSLVHWVFRLVQG